jgi:hypothetical protein
VRRLLEYLPNLVCIAHPSPVLCSSSGENILYLLLYMGRISIYVATLKQHLHKEYIYISHDHLIPYSTTWGSYQISLIERVADN